MCYVVAFGFALHQLRPFTIDILQPITSSLRMVTGGGAGAFLFPGFNLRLLMTTLGYDHINIESFDEKGVYYSNTPNAIGMSHYKLLEWWFLADFKNSWTNSNTSFYSRLGNNSTSWLR